MKKQLLLSLLSMITILSIGQNDLSLKIEHLIGDETLLANQSYDHNELNYSFSVSRLEYYISQIEIIHDGGMSTSISDTWLLINGLEDQSYTLGNYNINVVEEIHYWIGVEPEVNHLDPTTYPEEHPLALKNPSMHWGWTSGYRFAALEGKTGPGLVLTYQIHSLGDGNYHQVVLPTSSLVEGNHRQITIEANYLGLLKDLNVSGGLISHSETGESALMLENFSTEVFSQLMFTDVDDQIDQMKNLIIAPNPASINQATLYLNQDFAHSVHLQITDLSGRLILEQTIEAHQSQVHLDLNQAGIYFVNLIDGNKRIETRKLIISQ